MEAIHGGDIYRNCVQLDFSVNVNPLGIPEGVKAALHEAVEACSQYPDISVEGLRRAVSAGLGVPAEYLLFGNGASELFLAVVHGLKPAAAVIPAPSFFGYTYAARAAGIRTVSYETRRETGFRLEEGLADVLTEEGSLLFLANPNNPTGRLTPGSEIRHLLAHCREKGIWVVLDECFIEFCGEKLSLIRELEAFPNVILVRAYTKIFAIPGVRLGYLACSDGTLREKIAGQLPEWNVSTFAQMAGCVCAGERAFVQRTAELIKEERRFLEESLRALGVRVYPGSANFLLLYEERPLYEPLLERGILIRDCSNFRGLSRGFYRIAVKTRQENRRLLEAMAEILGQKKTDGGER